MKHKVSN